MMDSVTINIAHLKEGTTFGNLGDSDYLSALIEANPGLEIGFTEQISSLKRPTLVIPLFDDNFNKILNEKDLRLLLQEGTESYNEVDKLVEESEKWRKAGEAMHQEHLERQEHAAAAAPEEPDNKVPHSSQPQKIDEEHGGAVHYTFTEEVGEVGGAIQDAYFPPYLPPSHAQKIDEELGGAIQDAFAINPANVDSFVKEVREAMSGARFEVEPIDMDRHSITPPNYEAERGKGIPAKENSR